MLESYGVVVEIVMSAQGPLFLGFWVFRLLGLGLTTFPEQAAVLLVSVCTRCCHCQHPGEAARDCIVLEKPFLMLCGYHQYALQE